MENSNDFAVIDLGSNSFHLLIVRQNEDRTQIIYKQKETVYLAAGLDAHNHLNQAAIDRGVHCLTLFAERLKTINPKQIKVVATHTLRVAKNRNAFLLAASEVFPYPIEVISGYEEARLIYMGALNQELTRVNDIKLVIDIGGGSTEMALGQSLSPLFVDSKQMGCVSFSERFFLNGAISKKAFDSAVIEAQQEIEKITSILESYSISKIYGASGTIKSIHLILEETGHIDGLITKKRLQRLIDQWLEFQNVDELNFTSISSARKRVLLGGAAILYALFNQFKLKEVQYTQGALREGVLDQMLKTNEYKNVCERSITHLTQKYQVDAPFAQEVLKIVKFFYKQWHAQAEQKVSSMLKSILYWATLVHEVGLSINFSHIQKHSAYILEHSDLPGFNEEQQLLLSTLVRFHRKNIKFSQFPAFNLFHQTQWQALLQLLRLAILMNTQRAKDQAQKIQMLRLELIDRDLNCFALCIPEEFAKNNQLMMADLKKEQQHWAQNPNWALQLNIIEN